MSLVEHARRELALIGEDAELVENLVATVARFAEFGHSGGSAPFAIDYLSRLLRQEALTPLTSDPAEWEDRSEMSGYPLWQNRRDGRAFSADGGKTWRLVTSEPKLYGVWRVSDNLAETGWVTAEGRVIVSDDAEDLAGFMSGTEVREYPDPLPHSEWASVNDQPKPELGEHVRRTGPEHYREGIRLLAEAAAREADGRSMYGEHKPHDAATGLLVGRGHAHLTAAGVALLAAAEQPDSVSWREVLGL